MMTLAAAEMLDRTPRENIKSIICTVIFIISEMLYAVFTLNDQTPTVRALKLVCVSVAGLMILVLLYRISKPLYSIMKSFFRNGELQMRYLPAKNINFVIYSCCYISTNLLVLFCLSKHHFDFNKSDLTDESVFHISVIIESTIICLLPKRLARAEISRAQVQLFLLYIPILKYFCL